MSDWGRRRKLGTNKKYKLIKGGGKGTKGGGDARASGEETGMSKRRAGANARWRSRQRGEREFARLNQYKTELAE